VSSGHKALLACFPLMVRCVGVVWWLRVSWMYNLCKFVVV
jgi:hypothetical protein